MSDYSKRSGEPIAVLQIITRLIVGGAQETVVDTASLLDSNAFEVKVLSGPQTGSEGSLIEEVHERGVPLTILPTLVRQLSPVNDLRALWSLYRYIAQHRFDIVHTNSSKAGILGRLAARMAGVPVIVHTVHGWSFHEHMPASRRRLYIFLEKLVDKMTSAFVVVTDQDIEKGLNYGIGSLSRYHLIRSAISLDAFNPFQIDSRQARAELGLPSEAPVIGCVGRFSEQKNPLEWIRVAAGIAEKRSDCCFLMVGDGPLRAEAEALIEQLGLSGRFVLPGLRRDVHQMFAAMDVFLLTSLWEGLPRTIPQAMAMRIPVVAMRADGTAEAVLHGETGFLCDKGNTTQMADFCVQLIDDPQLRRNMGLAGRRYALEEFDVEVMIERIANLYQILLHNRRTSLEPSVGLQGSDR